MNCKVATKEKENYNKEAKNEGDSTKQKKDNDVVTQSGKSNH